MNEMKPTPIAIVGMAGRFPGARNISAFWHTLRDGLESIRDRSDAELRAAGATSEELANPDYIKRASMLDDVPMFDSSFFGLSPRDASIMDPQHRQFLECAWEALEDAAHPPQRFGGSIGVYAGSGMNTYLIHNLLANRRLRETAGLFQLKQTGNDKDVLATRVSYQLDLRGPSINVQTACSTSLVAVHLACQGLLNCECDMALAGGVTIEFPHGLGYLYREGEILSRDGHCRSFDAASSGTVFASGLGIVVLRRLEDALADHDHIRAVILGSAVNNDGARKVGYLAPSVDGQAEVIAEALEFAGISADDISYVEAHGTGTIVGDPIEVRALTQAFRKSTARINYCALGSVKSNLGHLDAAAGVTGLIKTVLALEHAQLPPSLHFERLNPHIELKGSPFFVNTRFTDWPSNAKPRRAGVTSLGIGGTNAHVILEEARCPQLSRQPGPYQLLIVSAKTEAAADQALTNLAAHLAANGDLNLADVAFTCQAGRHAFAHRRAIVVEDHAASVAALPAMERARVASGVVSNAPPQIVFMFSGQGSQYVNMGRELYEHAPAFRETLVRCANGLRQLLDIDLIEALFPPVQHNDAASDKLNQTWLTQPALFSIEYSLACWWMSLGIQPVAMVGHSIGEYVAACIAGVFSLDDALAIVAARGRIINSLPAGSMLAVPLSAAEIPLPGSLCLAAINGPRLCVVSGPTPEIVAIEERLSQQSVVCRRLHTSHAFHSVMMDPALEAFEQCLRGVPLHPPRIPYLSNVTGTWIKSEQATNPAYWAHHIRETVRFSDCLAELFRKPGKLLLEAGPGNALTSLARQQSALSAKAFQSLPHPRETNSALQCVLHTLGQLWVSGAEVSWTALHAPGSVQRIPLPTYPFERQRFWIDPDEAIPAAAPALRSGKDRTHEWLYRRIWKPASPISSPFKDTDCWIVFRDSIGLGDQVIARLARAKQEVILVDLADKFERLNKSSYTLRPSAREDYDALLAELSKDGVAPAKIIHLWSVCPDNPAVPLEETLERSFFSPLFLAQALGAQDFSNVEIAFVSNNLQQVRNESIHNPARAALLGPARVIPLELPGIDCRSIDIDLISGQTAECAALLTNEMASVRVNTTIAYRGMQRYVESLEPLDLRAAQQRPRVVHGGVYLITGGLGGIGLAVAEHLAREFNARLILVGRSPLPPEEQWKSALDDSDQSETNRLRIRKLIEIRSSAADLMIAQGDVTDLVQMRRVLALAHARFGKIDGVFHAAGILDDGPLMMRTAQAAARVLDPKIRGTLVLEEALADSSLQFLVLFSSISSILPPPGQIDYAAANAFLDAFALSRKHRVTVVNWGPWRDVGMAARSASFHPLLENRLLETSTQTVFSSHFSVEHQWLLSEHRLKTGKALLPGTGYVELAAAAFSRGSLHTAIEFRDVLFLAPFSIDPGESKEVRIQLTREPSGGAGNSTFQFSVLARSADWVEHATGTIAPCFTRPEPSIGRAVITARCRKRELVFDEKQRTRQEHYFDFGPRWHSLQKLRLGEREGLVELELDEKFSRDLSTFLVHPALLDLATGCSLYLTEGYESSTDLYLPFSYKRMRVHRPLPSKLFSYIRARRENRLHGEVESFDITLLDEKDQVLVEIESFSMHRIANPAIAAAEKQFDSGAPPSEPVQPIAVTERAGIAPIEGVRVLTQILLSDAPAAVVVASQSLDGESNQAPLAKPSPDVHVQPGEGIDSTLAGWWRDLLGVENVGPDDDFFSLGGHSLIGVRLFAKIKKTYGLDLELAALFETRTLRRLGDLIRQAQQAQSRPLQKRTCLVPIHPQGSRVPVFFIHALGGEVLFYEPLARYLGPAQPFYAFQSPLAHQDVRDITIEKLASIYLEEMRSFFPQGPYLIGGLSYGGLIAVEMAQQLQAQGSEPALLIVLDASVPGSAGRREPSVQLSIFLQNLRRQGISYLIGKVKIKFEFWSERLLRRVQFAALSFYRFARIRVPRRLRFSLMEEIHRRALDQYKFKPYSGKITLIRAINRGVEILSKQEDPNLGWGKFAQGELEIHDVPGGHMGILLEPNVPILAEKLKVILSKTETTARQHQPVAPAEPS